MQRRLIQPTLGGRALRGPRISLYVDESKSSDWLYIGVLAIRSEEREALAEALGRDREVCGYQGEVHFHGVSTAQKCQLAGLWLAHALYVDRPPIRFHILGIDGRKLNTKAFGAHAAQRDQNIYRRFLRTALLYPAKAFFPSGSVVERIIHDARNLAAEEYFDWHTPWRMRKIDGVEVTTDRVELLESDHRLSGSPIDSQMIQLIDLITGVTRVCMEATTSKRYPRELASRWLPLVERLTDPDRRRNRRSSYGYVGRCNVSFFPRHALTLADLADDSERARSSFYRGRRPALCDANQMRLFE